MNGRTTAIVLGAGASYCYSKGCENIPTQADIVGRLFYRANANSGEGFPDLIEDFGLCHSFRLGQYLRRKFNIPEQSSVENAKLDFWTILQQRGYTLESLYEAVEADRSPSAREVLADFESIIRAAVRKPTVYRKRQNVCEHHSALCEVLEPTDYVIDFNWDSVMSDALLYESHFWFPATGFGRPCLPCMRPGQKAYNVSSLVTLFHVHGSVVLFEIERGAETEPRQLVFLGPDMGFNLPMIREIEAFIDEEMKAGRQAEAVVNYEGRIGLGHKWIDGRWLTPIFVPPSKYKSDYTHWYVRAMKKGIHARLPGTRMLAIIGYSFPDADRPHLQDFFVPGVLDAETEVVVVNPSNDDAEYRRRVTETFPRLTRFNFSMSDFRMFVEQYPVIRALR